MKWLYKRLDPTLDFEYSITCSLAATTAALIAAGVAAAGGITSAVVGSKAAKSATEVQKQSTDEAIAEQKRQYDQSRTDQLPWLQQGQVSLAQLGQGLAPGGSLSTPYGSNFAPPTLADAQKEPGYDFAQRAGEQAIKRGASAAGGAFSTGELANLSKFNSDLATTTYQQAYNRALSTFNENYNVYNTNQNNLYSKLANTAGLGSNAAISLGQLGQAGVANTGSLLTQGGNALAAGTIGSANAVNNGIGSIVNGLTGSLTLQQLMSGNASSIGRLPSTANGGLPPNGYYNPEEVQV